MDHFVTAQNCRDADVAAADWSRKVRTMFELELSILHHGKTIAELSNWNHWYQ
jgi:hypothetical protein